MKKKSFKIIIFFIFPFIFVLNNNVFAYQKEIDDLANFINNNMDKIASRKRVVVVDFLYDNSSIGKLGQFLANELSLSISKKANNYEVLDREQLKSIVGKSDFGLKQPYNQKEIKDFGSKVKVGGVTAGTMSVFRNYVRLSISLISAYSGKVVATKSIDIPMGQKIKDLVKEDFQSEDKKTSIKGEYLDVIEHNGVRFELKQCKQLDRATMCSFTITSKKNDTNRFYLSNTSSLYDNNGMNYRIYEMGLGGRTGQSNYYVYSDLVPGVPENGVIYFERVSDKIKTVDFTVVLNDERNQVYKAVFKDVEVKK